jgi:hypothetical protein
VLQNIFILQFRNSWTRCLWNNGSGQGAPRAWPAPSNLNLFDFYFWENLKSAVYAGEVSNIQDLQQLIQNRIEMICITLGIFQHVRQSLFRCATYCTEPDGGHFRRPQIRNQIHKLSVHKVIFFLAWCYRFTICKFGQAFFTHLAYCINNTYYCKKMYSKQKINSWFMYTATSTKSN